MVRRLHPQHLPPHGNSIFMKQAVTTWIVPFAYAAAQRAAIWAAALSLVASNAPPGWAANQTSTVTPVQLNPSVPYRIEVRPYSMGAATLPTLHSYAVGEYDGKWLFLAGRTNGLHGFNGALPDENFPPASQNREVWVMDIANRQTWHRPLDDASSGLTAAIVASLSSTNTQFYQKGNSLYVTGGYGLDASNNYVTFDTLTAIELPKLGDWVVNGAGAAAGAVRQIHDPNLKVTGGAMYEVGGRTQLVFGQDYEGAYAPFINGVYTLQVRSFDISGNETTLSIANSTASTQDNAYRRRDLNVFPVLRPGPGGTHPGLVALSGVFTTTNGAWTVPVEIDANGNPSMDNPADASTFKQGMNNYQSAKVGFYSQSRGEMHEILLGGISLQYLDQTTGLIVTDNQMPFVNDITSLVIDAAGNYSQQHLGYFPVLTDVAGNRLRFGADAEFLLSDLIATFDNGIIDLDQITGETVLGHIFGGLAANAPHTRQSVSTLSAASNLVFEIVLIPVPEPTSAVLASLLTAILMSYRIEATSRRKKLAPGQ